MGKTNWKAIAELVGLAAIVASLVALIFELRQTQSAITAATYQARALDSISDSRYLAESEHMLRILVETETAKDTEAIARLSEIDRARLRAYLRAEAHDLDNEYYQYQHGFLDQGFFEDVTKRSIERMAPRWRAMRIYEGRREFRRFVDSLLESEE
jgi:hypothetical protein